MASGSRLIGETEFASLYAAAEFAAEYALWFDTTVTIAWSLLGFTSDAEIQREFTAYLKCLRAWFEEHDAPLAFIYGHEHGRKIGLHTHIALYVPEGRRKDFRAWDRGWPKRRYGRPVPNALRVRGPAKERPGQHWLSVSYLLKGFDRSAVVQSKRHAPNGHDLLLGDLIAWPWQDPGPVTMARRVGASRSIGPDRRSIGVPIGFDELLLRTPRHKMPILPEESSFIRSILARSMDYSEAKPFRSAYEDGARDIRLLYPAEFHSMITHLPI